MIGLLLFACQSLAPETAAAWARHGFAAEEVPARPKEDALGAAAWDLAQLVPARVSGRPVDDALRAAAVDRTLLAVSGLPDEMRALAYARLRGHLRMAQLSEIGASLQENRSPDRPQLLAILQSAPIEDAQPALLAFVLDEMQPAPERGVLCEHLLLALGRPALEALRPAIRPDAAPQFLRRVFAGWRGIVVSEDLVWLEKLAREGKEYAAEFALQLWAMHETDPERRYAIFRLALDSSPNYRQVAWDVLSQRGPHERIVEDLLQLLDLGDIDNRNLARRFLPAFGSPEMLWLAYEERASRAGPNLRAQWMTALAASPLEQARAEAAKWLAEHGRTSGTTAMAVARILGDDPVLDPILPALLTQSELPDRILWPLALRRAETSDAARRLLRERIELDDGLIQEQSLESLAPVADEADLEMIARIAGGQEYSASSRAVALKALAARGRAEPLLEEWLRVPPRGYELAEAFVRATVEHGSPEQLDQLLDGLERGLGFPDPDEQRGIRIAAWESAGKRGDARCLEYLTGELERTLANEPRLEADWPTLYDLSREQFELGAIIDATLSCARQRGPEEVAAALREVRFVDTAPHALFFAAGRFAPFLPELAQSWFGALDLESLSELDRLRASAWWAWTLDPAPSASEAYAALLRDPTLYREYPRALAEAFSPEGAAWTLFHDRIEERARLLRARTASGVARRQLLEPLLDGRCDGTVLADATELLTGPEATPEDEALALLLGRAWVADSPLSAYAHALLGELLDAQEQSEQAAGAWEAVLRTTPRGSELHDRARARLGQPQD